MTKYIFTLIALTAVIFHFSPAEAQENEIKEVETKIVEASMFKNGLSIITREFKVKSPGAYLVADVPEPVHGTFWVHSDLLDEVRITIKEIDTKPSALLMQDIQKSLAGRKVTINLKGDIATTGTVLNFTGTDNSKWQRNYERPAYPYYWYNRYINQPGQLTVSAANDFLAIKTSTGNELVRVSEIVRIKVEGMEKEITLKLKKPVMIIKLKGPTPKVPFDKGQSVRISYLVKGLSWAPAYTINLLDDSKGTIEQQAVIKNELESFDDALVNLISGFPSMRFSHVISPLSPGTNISSFFNQLAQRIGRSSSVTTQQAVMSNIAPQGQSQPESEVTGSEGLDLHYQNIGKRTMDEGDSLYVKVAKKEINYDRIVEWTIPDIRNERGRYIDRYERERYPEKFQDFIWDAIKFSNPFDFPMTTAPATVYTAGGFSGQQTSYWTDKGEQITVPVTKALSIRATHTERELPGKRKAVYIWGDDYRETEVEGTLAIHNHRKKTIKMIINRKFSGELIRGDLNPKETLLKEGVFSPNKRNELIWTLELKPGEKILIKYLYKVLVDI